MEKYLLYLQQDIEASIEEAPEFASYGPGDQEGDDEDSGLVKYVRLSELLGIPGEAFPPSSLLSDEQMSDLILHIEELWSAWNLLWDIPIDLPEKNHYDSLVREMKEAWISYHPEKGGEVIICDFASGKTCPFQPDNSYCYCREIDESARHDIALWEEYVRSQGLDPYREMTPEEEAAFEEEMRVRDLKKRYGDDWKKYDLLEWLADDEESEEDDDEISIADYIDDIILDNNDDLSEVPDHNVCRSGNDLEWDGQDQLDDDHDDELDLPF